MISDERVVDLDDRPGVIGDEEAFLQRIHQRIAKLVAVGEILGASALLFVTPCAVEESAGGHVERRQCLQQELQGAAESPGVSCSISSTSRAWFSMMSSMLIRSLQRAAAEFVTDRQAGLGPGSAGMRSAPRRSARRSPRRGRWSVMRCLDDARQAPTRRRSPCRTGPRVVRRSLSRARRNRCCPNDVRRCRRST